VKYFDWNAEKNEQLKQERGISFEDVVIAIEENTILEILEHPNKEKYPNQKMYIVNIENYAYIVPFVDEGEKRFLKTIFPSRKMTAKYIIKEKE
jgi:uncharacterized DUF497 family protein